jgi:hypothetical protein
MLKKIAAAIVILASFLLPFLIYSAEPNKIDEVYTLAPTDQPDPCLAVRKNSRSFEMIDGKLVAVHTLCDVGIEVSGFGIGNTTFALKRTLYCIKHTIKIATGPGTTH